MKRLLTGLFFILLLLLGAIAFFRVAPQMTPEPLKPSLGWVRQTQDQYTGQFIAWRNRLLGITHLVQEEKESPTAVLSDSATQSPLPRVDISRVEVAQVELDSNGQTTRQFEVGSSMPADLAGPVEPPEPALNRPDEQAVPARSGAEEQAAVTRTESPSQNPFALDSNRALAALTDTDDVLAKADAAIAAADAVLAGTAQRAGPAGSAEPVQAETTEPLQAEATGPVAQVEERAAASSMREAVDPVAIGKPGTDGVTNPTAIKTDGSGNPLAAGTGESVNPPAVETAGSVTGGAAIVLAQSMLPAPAPPVAAEAVQVARARPLNAPAEVQPPQRSEASASESANPQSPEPLSASLETANLARPVIAPPEVIPPDAPAPPEPVTASGRTQQATIKNFLAGQVVEFQTGRDVLTLQGRRALNQLLGIIQQNQDTVITIQGHTDNIGDESSNLELSTARSIRARSYLIARGVEADRLKVQGFGELRPVASNRTAEGRIRNRRIDFAVSDRLQ